jgi:hypothetical protein
VLGLQIAAASTQYVAIGASQRAFETLIDGDQWMIYCNVKTDVLHWDFVSLLFSNILHTLMKKCKRVLSCGLSLSLSSMLSG